MTWNFLGFFICSRLSDIDICVYVWYNILCTFPTSDGVAMLKLTARNDKKLALYRNLTFVWGFNTIMFLNTVAMSIRSIWKMLHYQYYVPGFGDWTLTMFLLVIEIVGVLFCTGFLLVTIHMWRQASRKKQFYSSHYLFRTGTTSPW